MQDDLDHDIHVNELRGVSVTTTKCSDIPGIPDVYKALWRDLVPIFICVVPTIDGGACYGDEGGAASHMKLGFRNPIRVAG